MRAGFCGRPFATRAHVRFWKLKFADLVAIVLFEDQRNLMRLNLATPRRFDELLIT